MIKNLKQKTLGAILTLPLFTQYAFADANSFGNAVDSWGSGWIGVAVKIGRYATGFGVIGLAIAIAINNDDNVGKKLKIGILACLVCVLLLTAYDKLM